jgi:putative ABC transport system permease protein
MMFREFRLAFRALRKQPGFTSIAVLTVALGVGANSAIFTVVDAVMLRPLPFHDADRVVVINERTPQFPALSLSAENYRDVCREAATLQSCGAFRNFTANMSGGSEPERVPAKMLSGNMLSLLGVSPVLGRGFTSDEDRAGGPPVAMLSHGLWMSRFGGREGVLQERILLDGTPYSIVGILPPAFRLFQKAEVYLPIAPFIAAQPVDRGWHPGILPVARLKDGVSLEQARTEVAAIAARLEQAYPETNTRVSMLVTPARDLMVQGVRTALLVLLGAVGGVLLIACINVAGLLLARGLTRRRDVAVRIALGARRARIVMHLLAESLLISIVGGAAGLLLASFAVPVLISLVGPTLPRADTVAVDGRVVVFTFGLALVTGVVFGLVPALQSTRVDVREALNETGRSGMGGGVWQRRARATLVVVEVAVTVVLTIGAALLIRSFARLQTVSPGFDARHTLAADVPLAAPKYANDELRTSVVQRLIERLSGVPGVRGAAVTTTLPMSGGGPTIHFNLKGFPPTGPEQYTMAGYRAVSADYFRTIGIPLRQGRLLDERDRQGSARVVVVNETMARTHLRGNPLGQRIQLGTEPDPDPANPYMEVIGVVGDVRQQPDAEAKSEMYVPYAQHPDPFLRRMFGNVTVVIRADGDPARFGPSIREIVREADPDQPVANIRTLSDVISTSVAQPRFRTLLLGFFAAIALTLAAIGIYGLLSHGVAQRMNEFGVRMALGASPADVLRLVLRQGTVLALTGIAIGLVASVAVVRGLHAVLYEISPWDPLAWIVSAGTLLAVSLLASWIPARRALRVDPVLALRA